MAKTIFYWCFLLATFTLYGQNSYNFSVAQPAEENTIISLPAQYYGIYKSDSSDIQYEIRRDGIWIISTIYSAISRETIRESPTYRVRDGYLFGIKEGDSIPCVLDGEKYYFGLQQRTQIIGGQAKHQLKKLDKNVYLVNYFEEDAFTPIKISFKGKQLVIQQFDYESTTDYFTAVKIQNDKTISGLKTITLSPTQKEWEVILKKGIFGSSSVYKMQ